MFPHFSLVGAGLCRLVVVVIVVSLLQIALGPLSSANVRATSLDESAEVGPQENVIARNLARHRAASPLQPLALDSAIIAKMNQYKIRGTQAVIMMGDSIVWRGNYGYAGTDTSTPVADTTLFLQASISKTILAVAIMQMAENGLIGLDTNLNDYLDFEVVNPYFPDSVITIRSILAHVSSINRNDETWVIDMTYGADSPLNLETYLGNYLQAGGATYHDYNYIPAPPREYYLYSNYAFSLLGLVVEYVSGDSLEKYCRDSIFVPLGMNETSWFLANLPQSNIAMPNYYYSGHFIPYGHLGIPIYPCAQIRTSAQQLARHLRAFMNFGRFGSSRVLDSNTVVEMQTVQYPGIPGWAGESGIEFGLGWFRWESDQPGEWAWGHDGGLYGVLTAMYCLPSENFGVIMLQNTRTASAGEIYQLLWDFARDSDHDGIIAGFDNCPSTANSDQSDEDDDGIGDICDNCPLAFNPDQLDTDGDELGDACDSDLDDDGTLNSFDNCPFVANPGQEASDSDSLGDACDNCPLAANDDQFDENHDGIGDMCDGFLHIQVQDFPDSLVRLDYFDYTFHADGGTASFNWQLLGGDLPFGLTLEGGSIGRIFGRPTIVGDYFFSVRCNDTGVPVKADTVYLHVVVVREPFLCGDADGSGIITISDAVYLIGYIFGGGPAPNPVLAGDADCNGIITISDAVYLINYIFAGGPAPCAACK